MSKPIRARSARKKQPASHDTHTEGAVSVAVGPATREVGMGQGLTAPGTLTPRVIRNPYIVGGWVRGSNFYGRTKLLADVLGNQDRTIWLGGNRRIGKTSMLRRLEELGNSDGWIAFYIDIQGAETAARLTEYFLDEDNEARLQLLGLTGDELSGSAPHEVMRKLDRSATERNLKVLLLLDEAEALIEIVDNEGDQILKDLQREMQRSEALRVVLSATKRLMQLDEICSTWNTSKFLDGVTPRYLGALERDEALALVQQAQSPLPLPVDEAVVRAIFEATNGHPFLIQWLCDRLWSEHGLRAPSAEDLALDNDADLVTRMFQEDYNSLAATERTIVKTFATTETLDEVRLAALIGGGAKPEQMHALMAPLAQLCYVRRVDGGYAIGSQLLRNWFCCCTVEEPAPAVSDAIASDWADEQIQEINNLIEEHERRLQKLLAQQAQLGISTPPQILNEIEDIQHQIAGLQKQRSQVRANR
jgi:hypothetical protein